MKTAADYLDAIRARHHLTSDRQLAALIGVPSPSIVGYRAGHHSFSDTAARRIAELLDLDPAEVLITARALAAKCPEDRAAWELALSRLHQQPGPGMCIM